MTGGFICELHTEWCRLRDEELKKEAKEKILCSERAKSLSKCRPALKPFGRPSAPAT